MSYILLDNVFQKIDYFDPNVLIDIYIKFVIIASIFYILYKYYLIDITINYIFELLDKKLIIYLPSFKNIKQNNSSVFTQIDNFLKNYINTLNNQPSTANSTINDTNMIIIFATLIISLFGILCTIIFISNGYKYIDFKNVGYSLLFNIIFISLSQFIVFYVLYRYIDPLQVYNLFYYNYVINPIKPNITLPPDITLPPKITLQPEIITTASITDELNGIKTNSVSLVAPQFSIPNVNPLNNQSTQPVIINSTYTGTLFIFINIFIFVFIIMFILSILNYLVIYNNYNVGNRMIPFTELSLLIYIILTLVSLLGVIILLLLLMNIL